MIDNKEIRPLVYEGVSYSDYLVFANGKVWSKKRKIFLKPEKVCGGKSGSNRIDHRVFVVSDLGIRKKIYISHLIASVYDDMIGRTPLVRHFGLTLGRNNFPITTETGAKWTGPKRVTIDHIDRNPLNNHVSNIRLATDFEQSLNSESRAQDRIRDKEGNSVYKGVSWHSKGGKYQSQFYSSTIKIPDFNNANYNKYNFECQVEAAKFYNESVERFLNDAFGKKLCRELLDEVAYLNFIEEKSDFTPYQKLLNFFNIKKNLNYATVQY